MYRRTATLVLMALAAALVAAPAADAQQRTRVVRVAFPNDDGSLTPYTFANGYALMTLVYDTLSWRDARGIARPWLARTIRRRPGREIEVVLRRGLRWQDGRALTASDVAFTYAYMKTRFHPRFTPQLRELEGVRVASRRRLVFELRSAALGFEDQPLADVPILPRHLWQNLPPGRAAPAGLPVGSGPYRLVRYVRGRNGSYRFEANARYFLGRPAVDRIDVPVVVNRDDAVSAVADHRVDMASLAVVPGTRTETSVSVAFSKADSFTGTMLAFNLTRPPFDRLAARRAVASALDLRRIAGVTGGAGGRIPALRGMLHPQSRWAGTEQLHRFDAAAARVAFSEQGIRPFTVAVLANDLVRIEAARRVALALHDAGASVRVVVYSPAAMRRVTAADGSTAPTFDLAVVGSPALASYDPSFLRAVFGPPADAPLNDGGYRSARFDRLADRVDDASTRAARRRAVRAELRLLARDLPVVPLFFGGLTFVYNPASYDGWVDVRGSGILDKRSFLPTKAAARPAQPAPADPVDRSGGDAGFSLVPFIVALVVLMLAGFGWAVRRGRA